jgi:hypothetical protein
MNEIQIIVYRIQICMYNIVIYILYLLIKLAGNIASIRLKEQWKLEKI